MAGAFPTSPCTSELIQQFCQITAVSDVDIAQNVLEASGGNIDMAVSMYMDSMGGAALSSSSSHPSNSRPPDEEVRAPIPQIVDVIMEHDLDELEDQRGRRRRAARPTTSRSIFDNFRDLAEETRQQESIMRGEKLTNTAATKLEDLFRPPIDIIHKGSLMSAQALAERQHKWVLVNIQNSEEFICQTLNRDVWKDPTVRGIIDRHFIFWQVYHDSSEGKKFDRFYRTNRIIWPYVAVIHPITAEKQHEWNTNKLNDFLMELRSFVFEHPQPDGLQTDKEAPLKKPDTVTSSDVEIDDEDAQLAAAIRASLNENNCGDSDDELQFESDDEYEVTCGSDDSLSVTQNGATSKASPMKQTESQLKYKRKSTPLAEITPSKVKVKESVHSNGCSPKIVCSSAAVKVVESWTDLIQPHGDLVKIQLRLPEGGRQQISITSASPLRALFKYCSEQGYPPSTHELTANFPLRKISSMSPEVTLKDAAFQSQETIFIQKR